MKAIMVMFDSLNRNLLPEYGCDWTRLPNFQRLAEKTVVFDNCYAGSLPCMPARRELHTGRYNFLHRSWSPMEPFDESCITNLDRQGVFTHLASDHVHYWEDGGSGYYTKYKTWDVIRGQEGDRYIGQVKDPVIPETYNKRTTLAHNQERYRKWRQDWVNREYIHTNEEMPQTQTFDAGIRFLDRNASEDNWFLQIESFDPHEPFFSLEEYQKLYPHNYHDKQLDWPDYGENELPEHVTEHIRYEYASLLSMCDANLGRVLDKMDEYDLWKDTLLIVNTDHGFMLGEKNWMGKNFHPLYNEIARLPLFIYDPRSHAAGKRSSLVQTIDLAPTLLDFFGAEPLKYAQGHNLKDTIEKDIPVRDVAIWGMFGKGINGTDGRYVYLHGYTTDNNQPLYEYTLMPTHMSKYFDVSELQKMELVPGFSFMQNCQVLKIESSRSVKNSVRTNLLYDLQTDPLQEHPITDYRIQGEMIRKIREVMKVSDCPKEQFERLGIPETGILPEAQLAKMNKIGEETYVKGYYT